MRSPDLLIIGGQKCGTTAARINLSLHPHIAFNTHGGQGREVHFFDRDVNWERGLEWYHTHFQEPAPVLAEKTPNYLHPHALARIGQALPHAKLLILLRNPIDRAYSQWNHFNQQPTAAGSPWRLLAFENAIKDFPTLLRQGHYVEQLRNVYQHFPREQVHVAITERVQANMPMEYARMLDFAGLAPVADPDYKMAHVRSYEARMQPRTRAHLYAHFRRSTDDLRELLGDALPEWDPPEI